jgi:hypothetical protein
MRLGVRGAGLADVLPEHQATALDKLEKASGGHGQGRSRRTRASEKGSPVLRAYVIRARTSLSERGR